MTARLEIEELMQDAYQHYMDGRPKMALKCDLEALQKSRELGEIHLLARAHIEVSRSYRWLHKPKQAIENIHAGLALFNQFDDPELLAFANYVHARILMQVGLTDDAYNETAKSLTWAENNDAFELQVRVLDIQAIIFTLASNFEKAATILEQAQSLQDQHGFVSMKAVLPLHRGFFHSRVADVALDHGNEQEHKDNHEVSLMLNKQAIAAAKEYKQSWHHFVSLCNAAESASVGKSFDAANQFLQEAAALPDGILDVGAVHYLYTRSEVANRSGNGELAVKYGLDALEASKENPDADNVMNAHRRVAEAYEIVGDFEAALKAHKLYMSHFRKQHAQRAYWQECVAEYKNEVKDMRDELMQANVRAEKMTQQAHQDPLTGLGNRRAFDQLLVKLDADETASFAIAVLDLDHFKRVNDRHSHLVGDNVLRFVADIMQENVRKNDLVTRIGGEEFAILLPKASLDDARIICERIRKHIGSWDWASIEPNLRVSTSGGIAMSYEGRNTLDVLSIADKRLYHAKAQGRNRIEAFALPDSVVNAS